MNGFSNDGRIIQVLGRLDAILEAENGALGSDPDFDVGASNISKSRCLYDLTSLTKHVPPEVIARTHGNVLRSLHAKLERNNVKVKAHLEAVREVTDLLRDAAIEAEADGTYTMEQFYLREAV
jgi:hypothetical protein